MTRYSDELKEQIVKKMTPPSSQSVADIARETGISAPTLYAWKRKFQQHGYIVPSKGSKPHGWDARARSAAVIKTAAMNEAERSGWCREQGVYPEQLQAWKQGFGGQDNPASQAELASGRKRRRRLEKEFNRKERALAEAAALLTLSKKAEAIWGRGEDDWSSSR